MEEHAVRQLRCDGKDMRYHVEVRHLTALQKRMYPDMTDRPFAVVSEDNDLVDRYRTRSGAQARADRMNSK